MTAKASSSQDLEEELELLMAAAEMAFDDRHTIDFYLDQLREKVEAKRRHLEELNSQWYGHFIDFHEISSLWIWFQICPNDGLLT